MLMSQSKAKTPRHTGSVGDGRSPLFPTEVLADARAYLDMCASDVESTSLILCVYGNGTQREVFQNLKMHKHPKDRLYVMCAPSNLELTKSLVGPESAIPHPMLPDLPLSKGEMIQIFRKFKDKNRAELELQKIKRAWEIKHAKVPK